MEGWMDGWSCMFPGCFEFLVHRWTDMGLIFIARFVGWESNDMNTYEHASARNETIVVTEHTIGASTLKQ